MSVWSTVHETPSQKEASIVFTEGATICIDAPADKVFNIIVGFSKYSAWNTWSPSFAFSEKDDEVKVGSHGTLVAKMEAQNRDYQIPVEVNTPVQRYDCGVEQQKLMYHPGQILRLSSTPEHFELAWRGLLMPSWLAISERVQVVTPAADGKSCEVRNWESMSGWGSYVLKNVMGVPKQLQEANLKYLNDLKSYAEQEFGTGAP